MGYGAVAQELCLFIEVEGTWVPAGIAANNDWDIESNIKMFEKFKMVGVESGFWENKMEV